MENKFCTNCGSKVTKEDVFCPECGNKIVKTEENVNDLVNVNIGTDEVLNNPAPTRSSDVRKQNTSKGDRSKLPILLLGFIVIILVIIAGWYFVFNKDKDSVVLDNNDTDIGVVDTKADDTDPSNKDSDKVEINMDNNDVENSSDSNAVTDNQDLTNTYKDNDVKYNNATSTNYGLAVEDDNFIYYYEEGKGIVVFHENDFEDQFVLEADMALYINVLEKGIYYVTYGDLVRFDISSETSEIIKSDVSEFIMDDVFIYYVSSEDGTLNVMTHDGSNSYNMTSYSVSNLNQDDTYLFYLSDSPSGSGNLTVTAHKKDGTSALEIDSSNALSLTVLDNYYYYIDADTYELWYKDLGKLYDMETDITVLIEDPVYSYFVGGDNLYVSLVNTDGVDKISHYDISNIKEGIIRSDLIEELYTVPMGIAGKYMFISVDEINSRIYDMENREFLK